MATYMLSETPEGWVRYDDEGRTALLDDNLGTALLDAGKVMRNHCDPAKGGWAEVPNQGSVTLRFTPAA